MIYSLRKKMIWICSASVIAVFGVIFLLICIFSVRQLNSAMDTIADRIAENGGAFPEVDKGQPMPPEQDRFPVLFAEETRISMRFFIVRLDASGNFLSAEIDSASAVTEETARACAEEALDRGKERGWIEGYRYKVTGGGSGQTVVFVDGSMNRSVSGMTLLTAGAVLVGSLLVIVVLIVLFSKRAVRPLAESYEKQKQFITDANHELKTPLTLILTNLDIVESEFGKNEWLEDMRAEGERMHALVRQLVLLSKMDEEGVKPAAEPFSISDTVSDTVSEFKILTKKNGLELDAQIQPDIIYTGSEALIRRLVSILLDNAVKYCDPVGRIILKFYRKRKLILTVENTCRGAEQLELDRLFDRFYRADKARSADGGFGIGLSIAKAIVRRHHGDICACRKGSDAVEFKVTLK